MLLWLDPVNRVIIEGRLKQFKLVKGNNVVDWTDVVRGWEEMESDIM